MNIETMTFAELLAHQTQVNDLIKQRREEEIARIKKDCELIGCKVKVNGTPRAPRKSKTNSD